MVYFWIVVNPSSLASMAAWTFNKDGHGLLACKLSRFGIGRGFAKEDDKGPLCVALF